MNTWDFEHNTSIILEKKKSLIPCSLYNCNVTWWHLFDLDCFFLFFLIFQNLRYITKEFVQINFFLDKTWKKSGIVYDKTFVKIYIELDNQTSYWSWKWPAFNLQHTFKSWLTFFFKWMIPQCFCIITCVVWNLFFSKWMIPQCFHIIKYVVWPKKYSQVVYGNIFQWY